MKKFNLILSIYIFCTLILLNSSIQAQSNILPPLTKSQKTEVQDQHDHSSCGLQHSAKTLLDNNTNLQRPNNEAYQQLEEFTQKFINKGEYPSPTETKSTPYRTIPVVFHMVHVCGEENITEAQAQQALDQLNDDFNAQNSDLSVLTGTPFEGQQTNINLQFKLAEIDPDGNATTGITRTKSTVSYEGTAHEFELKNMIQWDRSKYLNVWIVNSTGLSSGYAHYPSTADTQPYLDGIVMNHSYAGTTESAANNLRPHILAHEVGHWLNLQHTWGDDNNGYPVPVSQAVNCNYDDQVTDTPNTIGNVYITCPTTNVSSCGSVDNVFNMMDYGCEVMFTADQYTRMYATLASSISQRNVIGTSSSNTTTFLSNPNHRRLTTEDYIFQESIDNNGTIENCAEITLSSGAFHPSFSSNNYTVSGLPAGLSMNITKTSSTTLSACITGTATNSDKVDDVDNISITFNSGAFYYNSYYTSLFNPTISGLSIDFRNDFELEYVPYYDLDGNLPSTVDNSTNADFTGFFSDIIAYLGIVYYNNSSRYVLYNPSSNPVQVLCESGSNNIAKLNDGVTVGPSSTVYRTVTGGAADDNDNTILWNSAHTDWAGQTGYMGIRFKSDCISEYNYAWVKLEVAANGTSVSVVEMVYDTDPNTPVTTGTIPPCVTAPENPGEFLYTEKVAIENISNTSTVDADGVSDYTNLTINLDPGYTSVEFRQGNPPGYTPYGSEHWYAFIDFDQDGGFDPSEKVLEYEGTDLVSGYASGSNPATAPYLNITTSAPQGTPLTMRVILSLYPITEICGTYQYGEVEDYTVMIGEPCVAPTASEFTYYAYNSGKKLRFAATAFNGQNHQFRYKADGASGWTTMAATTNLYSYTPNNLPYCTKYFYQLRVQCPDSSWTAYSSSKIGWTRPAIVTNADLDTPTVWCSGAHLYCYNHQGDNKIIRYRVAGGSWSSWIYLYGNDYYTTVSNLSASTTYQYDVRVKCGTTGIWSGPKYANFTTPSCKNGDSDPLILAGESDTKISVYPNPVQDVVNIEISGAELNTVQIFDIQGRLIKELTPQAWETTSTKVDISDLIEGVYVVQINGQHVQRITKL